MTRARTRGNKDNGSAWRGLAIIVGLVVGCIGLLTIETAAIVYHREGYRAVEFEIENVVPAKSRPDLSGRILPDGSAAEAYASEFEEVWMGNRRSTVRQVKPADELRALRLRAWHNPAVPQWLDEVRILLRSRRTVLPSLTDAVHAALIPLSILAIAAALVTWGAWTARRRS